MSPAPLVLRVRDSADEAQQLHALKVNAVAKALHDSTLVIPLSARQSVPHATARADSLGSDVAGRLEVAKGQIIELERDLRNVGQNWQRAETLEARLVSVQALALKLQGQLDALPAHSPKRPAGIPGLYSVTLPTHTITRAGHGSEQREAVRGELDTRHLDERLRQRLHAYLLSGADAEPFWYRRERQRFRVNPNKGEDDLNLLIHLSGFLALPLSPGALVKVGATV